MFVVVGWEFSFQAVCRYGSAQTAGTWKTATESIDFAAYFRLCGNVWKLAMQPALL